MKGRTTLDIRITRSKPYVAIAGGYTGMQPVGIRTDYTANIDECTFKNTSKAQLERVIRQYLHRKYGSSVRPNFIIVPD